MVAAYHLYVGVDYSSSTEVEVRRRCFGGDAEEVAKLLARGRSDCRILRGPVSDSHLVNAIAEAVGQNRKGQNVLIYFAGHAIRRHSTTHLLASSGSRDDAAGVDTHWILRLINGAQHLRSAAIVLDCCHSGCPDSLERDRFWLGATSVDATVDDEFHGLLVQCLAEHTLRALDLATLHMWIVERLGSPMPELAAWYSAPFVLLPQPAASVTSDFSEWWTSAAAISLAERGRLRTAFPLDLSFSELHRDELYIPPRARRLGTSGTPCVPVNIQDIWKAVGAGQSCLILGAPGSGKSFAAYLGHRALAASGRRVIAIGLLDILRSEEPENTRRAGTPADLIAAILDGSERPPTGAVILIDGIDESLVSTFDSAHVRTTLQALRERVGLLALCRKEEYETRLYTTVSPDIFDQVAILEDWRRESEFRDYVDLLASRGYKDMPLLLQATAESEALAQLTRRPLHARMLSLVWCELSSVRAELPSTLVQLYDAYLRGFAQVSIRRLLVTGELDCEMDSNELIQVWRDVAWEMFSHAGVFAGRTEFDAAVQSRVGAASRSRVASMILQPSSADSGSRFIHYTLFEFLVADTFTRNLAHHIKNASASDATGLFLFDMPREMRHYVTQLRQKHSTDIDESIEATFLGQVYRLVTRENADSVAMTAGNLVAYLLGRSNAGSAKDVVRGLLGVEPLKFRRAALYCQRSRLT